MRLILEKLFAVYGLESGFKIKIFFSDQNERKFEALQE
jgi:hypothetical protein